MYKHHNHCSLYSQWEKYFKWHLINKYIPFLGTNHLQAVQRFRQTVEGIAVDSSRASTCVSDLQIIVPYTLARLYTKYILPDGTRDEMNETADAIITTFKYELCTNTWLDQTTISAAIEKVSFNVLFSNFYIIPVLLVLYRSTLSRKISLILSLYSMMLNYYEEANQ